MSLDFTQSVYREHLLEHLLIGELLKHSWLHCGADLEVSQPSVDRSGHDVVLEANGITRHVQLKSSSSDAKTAAQLVHAGLSNKPSGCVLWTRFHPETVSLGPFYLFAGEPGAKLPPIDTLKIAKHTKGDASGVKKERPNLRVLPRSRFVKIEGIPALYEALFGSSQRPPSEPESCTIRRCVPQSNSSVST